MAVVTFVSTSATHLGREEVLDGAENGKPMEESTKVEEEKLHMRSELCMHLDTWCWILLCSCGGQQCSGEDKRHG